MQLNYLYMVVLLAILLIAGAAEYLGLLPKGSFTPIFFTVLGLLAPSPAFPTAKTVAVPVSSSPEIKPVVVPLREQG